MILLILWSTINLFLLYAFYHLYKKNRSQQQERLELESSFNKLQNEVVELLKEARALAKAAQSELKIDSNVIPLKRKES